MNIIVLVVALVAIVATLVVAVRNGTQGATRNQRPDEPAPSNPDGNIYFERYRPGRASGHSSRPL
jgi:hypothetical protein